MYASHIRSQITADSYTFDLVKEVIYLGSANTVKNDASLEIETQDHSSEQVLM